MAGGPGMNERVLVVEDEPNLAAGLAENLRAEGYVVDSLGDGAEAARRGRSR